MPNLNSHSPYRTQGDARCQHCGVFVWKEALKMKNGVWWHKICGRRVRLYPSPCTIERLKRKRQEKENVKPLSHVEVLEVKKHE